MADELTNPLTLTCPVPLPATERVLLAHGGGGRLTQELIERVFLPAFGNPVLAARHDGAALSINDARLAFTTDSYVVHPLEFPGGNIGDLAVNGTVNDLAMCGARPLWLSCGFILEEGLPFDVLSRVVASMSVAAARAGVEIVTGDTKVVDRGKGDGIFLNTAGVGVVESGTEIRPSAVVPGDVILVSGDLGAHGVAILSVREGLEFESPIVSDTAPLWQPVRTLLDAGISIHCLRDLTRGGLASALNEIAQTSRTGMRIEEAAIPISQGVTGACEILGLDPLYVACEGRFAIFVPPSFAQPAIALLPGGAIVGKIVADHPATVVLHTRAGGNRVLDMLSGEQLPRIC